MCPHYSHDRGGHTEDRADEETVFVVRLVDRAHYKTQGFLLFFLTTGVPSLAFRGTEPTSSQQKQPII